jgi:hypothetical protein
MNKPNTISVPLAGDAQLIVPVSMLVRAFLRQLDLSVESTAPEAALDTMPQIGGRWDKQGGFYAGVCRGQGGGPDYHLVVAEEQAGNITWSAATAWAARLRDDDHSDFVLPRRHEQALLYGNVPELFEKAWFWSSEQSASNAACAWVQHFDYGHQYYYHKSSELRARAVRRLIIQ